MHRILKSRFFLLALCVTLALTAAALFAAFTDNLPIQKAASAAVRPGEQLFSTIFDTVRDFFAAHTQFDALQEDNEALSLRIAELESQLRQTDALREENETLRQLMGLREEDARLTYLPAKILAASTDGWRDRYTIDRGKDDGIAEGMCVVTSDGLAGFICECAAKSATLAPLTAFDTACAARSLRMQTAGVLEGSFALREDGLVRLSYVEKYADLAVGDLVETSGAGGLYPDGILIGMIVDVETEEHALAKYALVRPFASLDDTVRVYVVTGVQA